MATIARMATISRMAPATALLMAGSSARSVKSASAPSGARPRDAARRHNRRSVSARGRRCRIALPQRRLQDARQTQQWRSQEFARRPLHQRSDCHQTGAIGSNVNGSRKRQQYSPAAAVPISALVAVTSGAPVMPNSVWASGLRAESAAPTTSPGPQARQIDEGNKEHRQQDAGQHDAAPVARTVPT